MVMTAQNVRYLNLQDLKSDSLVYQSVDTTLTDFYRFFPTNERLIFYPDLGNFGSAGRPLFDLENPNPGFQLGLNAFSRFIKSPDQIRFYNTGPRYTDLNYISGIGKNQYFQAKHGQNITPLFSFGLDYNRISSEGIYGFESNDNTTIDLYLWYRSPKEKYQAAAGFIFNRIISQENGGILNDSLFLKPQTIQREFETVRLGTAENNVIDKQLFLLHGFSFGTLDTLERKGEKLLKRTRTFSINHEARLSETRNYYQDRSGTRYYPDNFYDSTTTYNSVNEVGLRQKVFLSGYKPLAIPIDFNVGIGRNDINLQIMEVDTQISETMAFADGRLQLGPIGVFGSINRVLQGIQQGDQSMELGGVLNLKNLGKIGGSLSYTTAQPDFVLRYYKGNHYQWDNDFDRVQESDLNINYRNDSIGFSVKFTAASITNWTYLSFDQRPVQETEAINYISIDVEKNFTFGDFGLDNFYRGMLVNPEILGVPSHYLRHAFYFHKPLFKEAMLFQTGVDFTYYTKFNGWGYVPSNAMFYKAAGFETGGYPFLSFYVSAQVKRARFFARGTNLLQDFPLRGSFNYFQYPHQDRGIHLGLSWHFLD